MLASLSLKYIMIENKQTKKTKIMCELVSFRWATGQVLLLLDRARSSVLSLMLI